MGDYIPTTGEVHAKYVTTPQAAVEAGAKEVWRWYVGPSLDGFDKHAYAYDQEKATEAAHAVIEAALPHLREALAREVEEAAMDPELGGSLGTALHAVQREAFLVAARIVRGREA